MYSTPSPSAPSSPQRDHITGVGIYTQLPGTSSRPTGRLLCHTHSVLCPGSSEIPCGLSVHFCLSFPVSGQYPSLSESLTSSKNLSKIALYSSSVLLPFFGYLGSSSQRA